MERGSLSDAGKLLWRIFSALTIASALAIVACIVYAFVATLLTERPHKSRCTSHLEELAVAVHTYCADYDDMLPSSAIPGKNYRQSFLTGVGAVPQGLNLRLPPKPGALRVSWVQIIYDHVQPKDIIFCPSDIQKETYNTNNTTGLSYWWKLAIDKAWHGDRCVKKYQKLSDFSYPRDQILLYERAGFHIGESNAKNGSSITVAYLDSHVKVIELKNATSGNKYHCATNSDGEPMYFNYNPGTDRGLSSDKVPAKYVDPATFCDRF